MVSPQGGYILDMHVGFDDQLPAIFSNNGNVKDIDIKCFIVSPAVCAHLILFTC